MRLGNNLNKVPCVLKLILRLWCNHGVVVVVVVGGGGGGFCLTFGHPWHE